MHYKSQNHILHYLPLALLLLIGAYLLLFATPIREIKVAVLGALLGGYIVWGLVHHAIEHTLHINIILEFFGFALFLFTVVGILLYIV